MLPQSTGKSCKMMSCYKRICARIRGHPFPPGCRLRALQARKRPDNELLPTVRNHPTLSYLTFLRLAVEPFARFRALGPGVLRATASILLARRLGRSHRYCSPLFCLGSLARPPSLRAIHPWPIGLFKNTGIQLTIRASPLTRH